MQPKLTTLLFLNGIEPEPFQNFSHCPIVIKDYQSLEDAMTWATRYFMDQIERAKREKENGHAAADAETIGQQTDGD